MKTVKLDFYGADTGHNLFCKKTNLKKKRHTYLDTQILKFSLVRDKSNKGSILQGVLLVKDYVKLVIFVICF